MKKTTAISAALFLSMTAAGGDVYEDLATYDWTSSREPLTAIAREIRDAETPAALAEIENRLIAVLDADTAGYPAKQFVCRMLRRMGTKASVPALSKLLPDEQLSHMARFALTRMPCPEAGAALIAALDKTDGDLKVGVIDSIGRRRDPKAVAALGTLLGNRATALAAIRALGNIGGKDACAALAGANLPAALAVEAQDAQLKCADDMLAGGNADAAARIYDRLFGEDNAKMIRIAALRGIVMARKEKAVDQLAALLQSGDEDLAKAAGRYIIEVPGTAATEALAGTLDGLSAESRAQLLGLLAERGDTAASPAVAGLIRSDDQATRVAAIRALAVLGDASCVPALAKAAAGGGETGQAAIETLNRIRGDGVGAAMSRLLASGDAAVKAGIIKVMATRADRTVAPALLTAAADKNADIRREAITGLAAAAGPEQVPGILALLLSPADASERPALARALSLAALRADDPPDCAEQIAPAVKKADNDTKPLLLSTLGRLGGTAALDAVRGQLDAKNADVARAAVKALQGWPDPAPAPDLLKVIKTTGDPVCKTLAFRGYIRMANLSGNTTPEQRAGMYRQALDLASTPEEKKAVLGGLTAAHSAAALQLAEGLLDEKDVRAEAELAVVEIAANIRQADPERARAALKKAIETAQNAAVKKKAQSILNEMDKNRGFVVTWLFSGPYTQGDPFKTAFAPEKKDAEAEWRPLKKGVGPKVIDLSKAFGGSNRAVYLKTGVYCPAAGKVTLAMGSDDGIQVWVNGKKVHAKNAARPLKIGEDTAPAALDKGWNTFLVKISQGGGDWAFCMRVCEPGGGPLERMRVDINKVR